MWFSLTTFFKFSLLLAALAGFLFFSGGALADASSSDAIAVRVMANDNNYSAVRWYKEQKFSGAPQDLLVDGYEAVRDGRTVYVNAANINAGNFYTQIYIISYNQAAQPSTVDIFGQILSHWKFNSNSDPESNFNGKAGVCSVSDKTSCIYTSDCPAKEYCLSDKAKLIRDTKRLADLANLKSYLETYSKKNDYPRLAAGSYIASSSVSVWPSWQATLAKELGVILPLDPINKLEPCAASGYDEKTCWDQATKNFYFNFNSDSTADKSIAQSAVYWYQNGEFNVNLETKAKYKNLEKIGGVNFSNLDTSLRFEPALHEITAAAGQNFEYQIKVYDPFLANQNAYNLGWAVENPAPTFLQINISKTAVSNIAKITGTVQSGQNRAFVVKVKVTDKRVNKSLEESFKLTIASVCDNKTGYHLENGTCVQCPINTQTTESVSWSNGKCAATACQNEEENSGFHVEGGICKSNTDIYFCPKPEGVSGLTRYWNLSADNWGDCQITSCWTDKGYHLENGQCVQCRAANAASVKWDSASNACQATVCDEADSYYLKDGSCLKCGVEHATEVKVVNNVCQPTACENGYVSSGATCAWTGGVCGPAHQNSFSDFNSMKSAGFCSQGYYTGFSNTGSLSWTWVCVKQNNQYPQSCIAVQIGPGRCALTVTPSANDINSLCELGIPSPITGNGPWNWTCQGEEGAPTSCSAPLTCDSANGYHLNYKGDSCTQPLTEVCNSIPVIHGAYISAYLGTQWSSCQIASTDPAYPYCFDGTHPQYPGQKICVNACGSTIDNIILKDQFITSGYSDCYIQNAAADINYYSGRAGVSAVSDAYGRISMSIPPSLIINNNKCAFVYSVSAAGASAAGSGCPANPPLTPPAPVCVKIDKANPYNWDINSMPPPPSSSFDSVANCFN